MSANMVGGGRRGGRVLPFAGIVVLKLQFGSFRGRAETSETDEQTNRSRMTRAGDTCT